MIIGNLRWEHQLRSIESEMLCILGNQIKYQTHGITLDINANNKWTYRSNSLHYLLDFTYLSAYDEMPMGFLQESVL